MRTTIASLLAVLALAACGNEKGSSLSRAFCNDLDDGYTLVNLWPRDQDPADFAEDAWGYIATTCPRHYMPNKEYFDSWGLPTPPDLAP